MGRPPTLAAAGRAGPEGPRTGRPAVAPLRPLCGHLPDQDRAHRRGPLRPEPAAAGLRRRVLLAGRLPGLVRRGPGGLPGLAAAGGAGPAPGPRAAVARRAGPERPR